VAEAISKYQNLQKMAETKPTITVPDTKIADPVPKNIPSEPKPKPLVAKPDPKPTDSQVYASIINDFLANSKCATEKEEKEYLQKLLKNKRFVLYMLYRGSEHGWMLKDFHDRCDNKGPTISLFKVKGGDCIGGYTKA
jgi:2,3-bisphosphoglycerate-independent phosphoglycerate mutase